MAPATEPVCGVDGVGVGVGVGDDGAGCWNEKREARRMLLRLLALAPAAHASGELALDAESAVGALLAPAVQVRVYA